MAEPFTPRIAPGHGQVPLERGEAPFLIEKGMRGELTSWDVTALIEQAGIPDKLFAVESQISERGRTTTMWKIDTSGDLDARGLVGALGDLRFARPREGRQGSLPPDLTPPKAPEAEAE